MDKNLEFVKIKKIERTIKALNNNNMNGYYIESKEKLFDKIKELVPEKSVVAFGGSMTIHEIGVVDFVKQENYTVLDRFQEGITGAEIKKIFKESFFADAYITSTNALTEEGELYNVDGTGNRVAAMMFGPEKVLVICGENKLVCDLDEAQLRMETIAAPANNKRLGRKTPCINTGVCEECNSQEKICRNYTAIKSQGEKDRIHVLILKGDFGY